MIKTYHYKSLSREGKIICGFCCASNKKEVLEYLRNLNLFPIKIRSSYFFRHHLKAKTLIQFCFNLQQLEGAGIPLSEALHHLSTTEIDPVFKVSLDIIKSDFMTGMVLSSALKKHSIIFDKVFINLIKVGEKTGSFNLILESLIAHLKWKEDIKKKIIKGVRYPAIITSILIGLLFILMGEVIPKLTPILGDQAPSLLLYIADSTLFFEAHGFIVSIIVILSVTLSFLAYFCSLKIQKIIDNIILKIPILGGFLKTLEYTRFFQALDIMCEAQIDLIEAFPLAIESVSKKKIRESLNKTYKSLCNGNNLSTSLFEVSPLILQIIKTGEKTDQMKRSLRFVKQYYEKNLYSKVEKFTTLIEPSLIIIVGLFLVGLVYFILMPMYDGLIFLEG